MKLFTCTNHDSHWPVGCASIVIARSEEEARVLLNRALVEEGLRPYAKKPYTLTEVPLDSPTAIVLCNGEY